jgi:hypothetical protein
VKIASETILGARKLRRLVQTARGTIQTGYRFGEIAMVQIQLDENVASLLADRARARGQSINEYVAELAIRDQVSAVPRLTGDEAVRLVESETGPGPRDYRGTYSRDDIYLDHN